MKNSIVFDTTSAATIADSDSVGAFLRASDGTLLTHTDVGGKKALDVRVAEGINVEVDLSHVDDSVKVGDGTDLLAVNADGSINITDNGGSLTVDAVNLDIRDLAHTQDSVKIGDGTDFLAIDASGNIGVTDAGGSLTVDAVNLDIRDLAFATDSVTVYQGTSPWVIGDGGSSISIDDNGGSITVDGTVSISGTVTVSDAALANTAIANAAKLLTAGGTAENLVTSPLSNRKYLFIANHYNRDMYIGASGVSATDGFPLSPGSVMELRCGAAIDIEFVSAATGHEVRTLELS